MSVHPSFFVMPVGTIRLFRCTGILSALSAKYPPNAVKGCRPMSNHDTVAQEGAVRRTLPDIIRRKPHDATVSARDAYVFGKTLLRVTLLGIGALLVLHMLGQFIVRIIGTESVLVDELVWRFNVDLELNVPTWYASFLTATASLVAFFVVGQLRLRRVPTPQLYTWILIAGVLLFIAIDETAALHELVLQTIHIQADLGEGQSHSANAWMYAMPFIGVAVLFGLKIAYNNLPRQTFRNLGAGVGVFLLGALVVEYLSIPLSDDTNLYNFFLTPLEEGLELLGVWLVLRAIIVHVRSYMKKTNTGIQALWR